jgi:mycofactocin precursor
MVRLFAGPVRLTIESTTARGEQGMKTGEEELKVGAEKEFNGERIDILEEIEVEDLTVDGICGVY